MQLAAYVGVHVPQYSPLFMIGHQVAMWPMRPPFRWGLPEETDD
jgi:hypothetical protein